MSRVPVLQGQTPAPSTATSTLNTMAERVKSPHSLLTRTTRLFDLQEDLHLNPEHAQFITGAYRVGISTFEFRGI